MFKQRLKYLRLLNNLTQDDLAKIINTSPSSISMYETGDREPNIDTIILIAKYFNVSTDYLLGLTNINSVNYSQGVEEKLDAILNYIKNK